MLYMITRRCHGNQIAAAFALSAAAASETWVAADVEAADAFCC